MKRSTLKHILTNLKQKHFTLAIFVLLVCVIASTQKANGATTYNAATEAEFNTAYASSVSGNGDIINITSNIVITSTKTIAKSITINGNSNTISVLKPGLDNNGLLVTNASTFRAFSITTSASVTINNLTIKGGAISGNGGAIDVATGCILKLNSCVITNSRSAGNYGVGGAIANNGVLYLDKSLIRRNMSTAGGGGFYNSVTGTMYIENSSILENSVVELSTTYGGGGIKNMGNLYINNSSISNNQCFSYGGGIYNGSKNIYIVNSSVTGNVTTYPGFKGGAISNEGGNVYAVNTLFAYNYHVLTDYSAPTAFELDDVETSSTTNQKKVYLYYCIYHAAIPSGTNNIIGNVQYTGLMDGTDNTIFSGGLFTKLTNNSGIEYGTAMVYRPFLYNNNGKVAPILKSSNFLLSNKGTQTRFANNNNVGPVVSYYNKTTSTWVNLTGVGTVGNLIGTDQVNTTRTNPPNVGAIEGVSSNLYLVKVQNNVNGTVTGGTIYGDIYPSGTSISLTATPNSSSSFVRWDYVTGGTGTASTVNPYSFTLTGNTILAPFYNTLSVSGTTLNFAGTAAESYYIDITSNIAWTTSSNQTWVSLSASGGNGNARLNFNAPANPTITTRSAIVKISAVGFTDIPITVTQYPGNATLSVSTKKVSIAKTINSTATIDVFSNTSWTPTILYNADWLKINAGTVGNGQLTFTVLKINPTITARTASINITASGASNQVIEVTQAAGDTTLLISASTADVSKTSNSTALVNVTSNTTWTVSSDQSWLTVNSGATGNATITVTTLSENYTISTRTAVVTIKAIGAADKTVTVTQAPGDATLSVSATTANLLKTANSTATIDVTSNSTWTATSNVNWISFNSGLENGKINITALADNPTITTRLATITLKANGVNDIVIEVSQAAGDPTLTVSTTKVSLLKSANNLVVIDITSNTTWTATTNQSWLTINAGTTGNGTLTCTTAANPTIFDRIATVKIRANGVSDKIINVTQAAGDPVMSISAASVSVDKIANSSGSIEFTNNVSWTATANQTWLKFKSYGYGSATLNFITLSDNPGVNARQAIVTIKATGVADKTITVTQTGADATLSISAITADLAKTANSSAPINVTSNTTWIAKSDQGWLSVTLSGTGNQALTVTALTANPSLLTRTATVTLKATGAADQTITVVQAAGDASLDISSNTASVNKNINSIASIDVISNTVWTATSNQSWLKVSPGATGDATITFTAATANPLTSIRTAIVTLEAEGVANKTITVNQEVGNPVLSASNASVNISNAKYSTANKTVASNTTWSATTSEDWLSVESGITGNHSLVMTTNSGNLALTTRSAIVTLKALGTADIVFTVIQEASLPTLTVSKNTVNIDPNANNTASVNISSNTVGAASSNQSWLTVSSYSSNKSTLTFTAANTTETRLAVVTISAAGISDRKINVIQSSPTAQNKYQMNMTVTAVVTVNDNELATTNTQMSVYIDDECRGSAKLQYVAAYNRYMAFIMVWGNKEDMNKTITFKSLNLTNNEEHTAINGSLGFMPETINGTAANPYAIRFYSVITSTYNEKAHKLMVYPNPITDAFRIDGLNAISTLSLTDVSGRILLLKQVSDHESVSIHTLPKGIYVLKIINKDGVSERKIVKQ